MVYLSLPENSRRQVSFYLAMEEYAARQLPADNEYFFTWQVDKSVIFGRNQVVANEVNIPYCQQHHIATFRRKSGGGCVYADRGNIMLSYVSTVESVPLSFNSLINMLLHVLRQLDVDAVGTAHNDVLVGNRKVSGTAFYLLPGRSIVHGTLLYDTDMDNMVNAITPSREKLEKKGIQSVRQRITLLKDHISQSQDELVTLIRQTLCHGERTLTHDEMKEVERIEQDYLRHDFIWRM